MSLQDKFDKFLGEPTSSDKFQGEWEVKECPEGKNCWCRMIFVRGTDQIIIPGAVITEQMANHIVRAHNQKIERDK